MSEASAPVAVTGVPAAVNILVVGAFAAATSEFMPSGLVPEIAVDLQVSIPAAGLVVSTFAIGMIAGALLAAVCADRLPRRTVLLGVLALLALGHFAGSQAHSFGLLLASRFACAFATGIFWTVATVVAVAISPQNARAAAIAKLLAGQVLASVVGIPAGTLVGDIFGWRSTFVAVGAISALSAVALAVALREPPQPQRRDGLRAELRAFSNGRLWLGYLIIVVYETGVMCLLTFSKPLAISGAGIDERYFPWLQALFGLGGYVGVKQLGGRFADRWPWHTLGIALTAMSMVAFGMWMVRTHSWVIFSLLFVAFGLCAFMAAPPLNARVFALSASAPTLASGVAIAAFNVGNLLGPMVGGASIAGLNDYLAPALAAGCLGAVACGLMWTACVRERRYQETTDQQILQSA